MVIFIQTQLRENHYSICTGNRSDALGPEDGNGGVGRLGPRAVVIHQRGTLDQKHGVVIA